MTKINNKNHKDKCKAYKAAGTRERNKARKLAKRELKLLKCKQKYGAKRAEKEAERKRNLLLKKAEGASVS